MLRVLGMLAGIGIGAVAGLIGGIAIGGLAGVMTFLFSGAPFAWTIAGKLTAGAAVAIAVGGGAAMIVAVIVGVWAGVFATLGKEARDNASFTWWIVNRLMFLAAVTSIQGSIFYFVMYAFRIDEKAASDLTGSLTAVIGVFIVVTALASGWLADKVGRKRLVGISGLMAAAGGVLLLGTIWVPNLVMIYIAGTVIGLATGLFMTSNWALGTDLVPDAEAGRFLGISNLAGAGAGIVGAGIGGLIADQVNSYRPGLGYFSIFAAYAVLFALSAVTLLGVKKR
jgi:hypothetical protein